MIRYIFSLFVFLFAFSVLAAPQPYRQVASEARTLLELRDSIDSLVSTGATFRNFTAEYYRKLGTFTDRYAYISRVLSLRPTLDRSLQYRLTVQQYTLSCEIAALSTILGAFDISRSEQSIIRKIPQYPLPYGTGGVWGDPEREFVGYYTGGQAKRTGYGVYEAPLAEYARNLGLNVEIQNRTLYNEKDTPQQYMQGLLNRIHQKDTHVILWGDWCTLPEYEDGIFPKGGSNVLVYFPLPAKNTCDRSAIARLFSWTTPEGKSIIGLSGEHAFILLGYIGSIQSPSHIIAWDTYTGRHIYPYEEWMRKWNLVDNRSLIISR